MDRCLGVAPITETENRQSFSTGAYNSFKSVLGRGRSFSGRELIVVPRKVVMRALLTFASIFNHFVSNSNKRNLQAAQQNVKYIRQICQENKHQVMMIHQNHHIKSKL